MARIIKKKKNKWVAPLALVLVLVLLIVALFAARNFAKPEEEAAEEKIVAFSRSGVIPTKVSFKGSEAELSFSYDNEKWTYDGDTHFPCDADAVTKLSDSLMKIEAHQKVDTKNADVDGFGLGDGAYTVTATFSDGRIIDFYYGTVNTYNGYQYFTYTDAGEVYLVDSSLAKAFDIKLSDVYSKESCQLVVDGAVEENVTKATVTTAGGQSTEITYEGALKTLFELASALNMTTWEDYYADEAEMKDVYGISSEGDSFSIDYTITTYKEDDDGNYIPNVTDKTYTVYFGNEFEAEGEDAERKAFYTVEGSSVVYSVKAETVDKVFEYLGFTPPAENEEFTVETAE